MRGTALLIVALVALAPVAADAGAAKKKPKPPCGFKLTRNAAHHDRVKIKMTCHRKFITNVRFTLRKKYTVQSFTPFPGGICTTDPPRKFGCTFGGSGAPKDKAVTTTVTVLLPVPKHDSHFADVEIFLSGGDPIGEQLGY